MADIFHQFNIQAPADPVFDAFCSSRGLDNWWPLKSSGQPKTGEVYTLFFGPEYDWRAKVIHVVTGKEITWKMIEAMEDWMGTEVGVKLTEEKGVTTVDFFHSGWREPNTHFRISTFCWGTLLNGLKQYVEKGTVVPFEQRN
jgi:uncharacterized protein YndB with AHSA1/START domain